MKLSHGVIGLLLLLPCEYSNGGSMYMTIAQSLAAPDRMKKDQQSDALRRPDLVLSFFEIEPGMTVLDLFSGGGYYTEILSRIVGSEGRVVAHNNQAYLDYSKDDLDGRFADNRLPNVERLTAEADEIDLPANTFDAVLAMLTWHDFYYVDKKNGWPEIDEASLVNKLCTAMKSGAVLGITDHVAPTGSIPSESAQNLHRIDPQRIKDDLSGGCFSFEGEIDALRNAEDDYGQAMFAQRIRGKTDRVVFKFRKN